MEHEFRVRGEILPLFDRGKELEIRVRGTPFFEGVHAGDAILFNGAVRRRVVAVRTYRSFEELLDSEDPGKIIPNASAEEVLSLLREFYSSERERRGVLVFALALAA